MDSVLFIAFHFPPFFGSSGIQRTLSFTRDLPKHGRWSPVVLTASPRAYPQRDDSQLADIPRELVVHRAFAVDAARSFAVAGRYPAWLATPDRWRSWYPAAVLAGLRLIRRHRIRALWSTYPIATAHSIGASLARLSGLPWIADFRDPMVEYVARDDQWYPADARLRAARLSVERLCTQRARKLVFCTETARDICLDRHPGLDPSRCAVIGNGFDEDIFAAIEQRLPRSLPRAADARWVFVHSGTLYPGSDRDPGFLFRALARLREQRGRALPIRVVLRGSGFEQQYAQLLKELHIADVVELAPPVSYADAIDEMFRADALLLFQGHNSNPAIPAKLYEYLRVKRPLFALVDPGGESARLLKQVGVTTVAPMEDEVEIARRLGHFLDRLERRDAALVPDLDTAAFSRERRASELEALLGGF